MKIRILLLTTITALITLAGTVYAGSDVVNDVLEGCATEKEAYCSQVTPGEGRLLACFYAHEDKLSNSCQYALYSAAQELEAAVNALNFVANECLDDITMFCKDTAIGNGRIAQCLDEHSDEVSEKCHKAATQVSEQY
jgi:hypothetical protein